MLLCTTGCRHLFMTVILFPLDIYPEMKLQWKLRFKGLSWRYVCLAKLLVLLRRYVYFGWLKVLNGNHGGNYIRLLKLIYIPLGCANTMCSSELGLEKWTQQEMAQAHMEFTELFSSPHTGWLILKLRISPNLKLILSTTCWSVHNPHPTSWPYSILCDQSWESVTFSIKSSG